MSTIVHRPVDRSGVTRPTAPPEEHALKADPFAQLKLLDLQELDSRIDQLRHQLATLPETAGDRRRSRPSAPSSTTRRRDAADRGRRPDRASRRKADADVEQVKTRRERDQERMDQGLITNPKDLERMQQELVSLDAPDHRRSRTTSSR